MADGVLEWFKTKGITEATVTDFQISQNGDGAVLFPYLAKGISYLPEPVRDTDVSFTKRRYGIPEGERSFRWERGRDPILFNRRDIAKRNLFLCEGETDTMRLRQEIGDNPAVGVVGLPGIETWNDSMAYDLSSAETVWVILDNDLDYKVAGRVDTAWRSIRAALGSNSKRVLLPKECGDICEFFEFHSLDALRTLVQRQPMAGDSRFRSLNLTLEPVPPRYLVKDMICLGDIHLFIGEPGIGKSWISMGLAQAVADGLPSFLGRDILEHGRVLYFDEENPEDLVFHRFRQLGLSRSGAKNIRYLSNVGVRLDNDPTSVLDEVLDFNPQLVVLDSLTRFHGQDENSAGAMAELFNTGIKPLARQSGASVVLIHHAGKGDSNSSYRRARGSGDITASVDSGFDFRPLDDNTLSITNFKSRRAAQGNMTFVSILDQPDNKVELRMLNGFSGGF